MNKQFVVKMMQAKQLQYEALKEIMPETMLKRVIKIEDELLELGKEILSSAVCNSDGRQQKSEGNENKVRKVTVE